MHVPEELKDLFIQSPTLVPARVILTILTTILTILLAARLYVRIRLLSTFGKDDGFIVAAYILWIFNYAVYFDQQDLFAGHIIPDDRQLDKYINTQPWFFESLLTTVTYMQVTLATFYVQNTCARISIIYSYRRFIPSSSWCQWAHRITTSLITLLVIICTLTVILNFCSCNRFGFELVSLEYIKSPLRHCLIFTYIFFFSLIPHVILDIFIYVFPFIFLHMSLQFDRKTRRGLYVLFAFGGFVLLLSMARITMMFVLKDKMIGRPLIRTNYFAATCLINTIEMNCVIIAACIPTLRPLCRNIQLWWKMRQVESSEENKASSQADVESANELKHIQLDIDLWSPPLS